ncbi:MAG: glycosyltransferase family 9 protein [Oligoflexia bacterium]|nr:glycosyltransferase family 9 protein [Oligoflexia bacterium]
MRDLLFVKYRALGDSLIGLGALAFVREREERRIVYAIPAWIVPLYRYLETPADVVMPLALESVQGWIESARQQWGKIERIHEFHQNGRSALFCRMLAMAKGARYTFYNHHKTQYAPSVKRDLIGVGAEGGIDHLQYTPEVKVRKSAWESISREMARDIEQWSGAILLGVSATRDTKMWPLEYYKDLVLAVLQRDGASKFIIPLSDSKRDLEIAERISTLGFPKGAVKILKVALEFIPLYFSKAKLFIGNDSGLKHLAVALNIKTISFFGPEAPLEWHPYDEHLHPYFYVEGLRCRTLQAHFCGKDICAHHSCLRSITVRELLLLLEME